MQADDFVITRYDADGTLDTSFGIGGSVVADVRGTGGYDYARGIAVDVQGRILVAGDSDQNFAVVYLGDGSLDASFGGDGIVTASFAGHNTYAFGVAVDASDRIVTAGYEHFISRTDPSTRSLLLARFDASGAPEGSFDGDGWASTDLPGETEVPEYSPSSP